MDYNAAFDELPTGRKKPPEERLYPFTLCLTPGDKKRLKATAKREGLTPATLARLAIQRLMNDLEKPKEKP
jgi:hypothetical protein